MIKYILVRLLHFIIALILYPFIYPFRKKSYNYVTKYGNEGYHPLQICNWFFTKEEGKGDWYTGPYWYMRKTKDKYFTEYINKEKEDPIAKTIKQKIVYFLISYRWSAIRNYMWNRRRMLFEEGGIWNGIPIEKVKLVKYKTPLIIEDKIKISPKLKYVNENNEYVDNKGSYVCYVGGSHNIEKNKCYIEGLQHLKFPTLKKDNRWSWKYAKVKPMMFTLFCIEIFLGWSIWYGWPNIHFKINFKKWDDKAKKDYNNYILYLKNQ
ncbi:MAG: hypothetical protein ACOC3V_03385 [bacterium]